MANQYKSYDTVGKKEDVSDIISNITPTKTPFSSMVGSETVHNTLFEWQWDDLRDPASNAQIEGFTAATAARTPTTKPSNYTQIMQDTFEVSGTLDAVSHYGRAKESAYQAAKAGKALKLDLESAYVGLDGTKSAGSASTARTFDAFQAQVHSSMYTYTGSSSAPTETQYLDAIQDCYNEGSDPSITMVTPTNARTFAGFAVAAGRVRDLSNSAKGEKALVNVVDIYVSPYGEQKIVLNRYQKSIDTLIFDPEMWSKVVLKGRNWFTEKLAKVGDKDAWMMVGEFSLKHKNPYASAVIRQSAAP